MSVDYFQKQIQDLESKNEAGFNTINLTDYLDSSLIRYLINKYRECGKVAPFIKQGKKLAIKSLYIDYDEFLDIQDFLKECKENQVKYSHTLIKILRKINFIVEMKG